MPTCATSSCARSARGELIPLSNLTHLEDQAGPEPAQSLQPAARRHDQRESRARLLARAKRSTISRSWCAPSCRPRRKSTTAASRSSTRSRRVRSISLSAIALLVVFLVLAAQFESFIHPLVIMVTVPLAVAGGLFGLCRGRDDAQYLQPDRHHHAGRHRGEERRADRRVHQSAARRGHGVQRGDRRGGAHSLPARDHDGVLDRRWAPCR